MEKDARQLVKLQSLLRAFLAVRLAEKRIKKHILRTKIANELLETESHYLRDIRVIHWEFNLGCGEVLSQQEQAVLFMNIGEIVDLHTELFKELHEKVRKKWSYHQTVADTIEKYIPRFVVYEKYITCYKEAVDFLHKSRTGKIEKYLQHREGKYCRGLTLESFLVMPIQRLPRYLLLLRELRKHTDPEHPEYALLTKSLQNLDELAKKFNEVQRDKETQLKVSQILNTVHGADEVALETPFIREGPISLKKEKVVKQGLVRSLSFSKNPVKEVWNELYVYLFKDTMLCAKKIGAASAAKTTILGCLHGANGKGVYKFSTTKAHTLRGARLEISAEDSCLIKLSKEKQVFEFRTANPQERDLWVTAFSATLVSR